MRGLPWRFTHALHCPIKAALPFNRSCGWVLFSNATGHFFLLLSFVGIQVGQIIMNSAWKNSVDRRRVHAAVNIKIIAESSTLYITERRATASASCCLNAFLSELTLWSKHKKTHCQHPQCQNRLLYCHYSHHGLITSKISFFPSYSLGASAMSVHTHVRMCVCVCVCVRLCVCLREGARICVYVTSKSAPQNLSALPS